MSSDSAPKFLSQADFARRRSVSRKAVTGWKAKGLLVLADDGRIDVEATEWKLDDRPACYRGGVTHRPVRAAPGNNSVSAASKAKAPPTPNEPAPRASDGAPNPDDFDFNDPNLPTAEAVRRKENFLSLKHKHDYEVSQKEWVRVEDVGQQVESEYAMVRERLLAIPGKMAALLVDLSRAEIEAALQSEINEALGELHAR